MTLTPQHNRIKNPVKCEKRRKNLIVSKCIVLFALVWITCSSEANTTADTFTQEKQYAMDQSTRILSSINQVDVSSMVSGITDSPDAVNDYSDVTQTDTGMLDVKGRIAQRTDPQSNTVLKSIAARPIITIDEKSDLTTRSQLIENNAQAIVDSNSSGDADCVVQTKMRTCTMPVRSIQKSCTQTPTVTIESNDVKRDQSLSGSIVANTHTTGTFTLPLDGIITQFTVTLKSNNVWLCHRTYQGTLANTVIGQMQGNCGHYLGDLYFSNDHVSIAVKKNTPLIFQITGASYGQWTHASYQLTLQIHEKKKTAIVHWQEVCNA